MTGTYSYDPLKISENGIDQMRFELGDTMVLGGAETCPLCDEEYKALLYRMQKEKKGWKYAKILCLRAITMKMAYEVNYNADGMSLSLNERYSRWKEILFELERSAAVPAVSAKASGVAKDGGHYFYLGMQNNPYSR